jgi:hypothetical protein
MQLGIRKRYNINSIHPGTAIMQSDQPSTPTQKTDIAGILGLVVIVGGLDWFTIKLPRITMQERTDAITQVLQTGALTADINLAGKQFTLDPRADTRELAQLLTSIKHDQTLVQMHLRTRDGKPVCTVDIETQILTTLAQRSGLVRQPQGSLSVQSVANICGISADALKGKVKLTYHDAQFQQHFADFTALAAPAPTVNGVIAQGTVIPQPHRAV